jgi:hypothetical protein
VIVSRAIEGLAGCALLAGLLTLSPATTAAAAPIVGTGSADIDPDKGVAAARKQAIKNARRAALDEALGGLTGSVDKAARKAVRKRSDAWTGAYRILDQADDDGKVSVRLEVDIDTVRLAKRLATPKVKGDASRWTLDTVTVDPSCAPVDEAWVSEELSALAAVSSKGSVAASVEVGCEPLGAVRYTHMQGAAVRVTARTAAGVLVSREVTGFGADVQQAAQAGAQQGLEDVGKQMRGGEAARLAVRIETPLPAARVRRLELAMRNSVPGVDDVAITAIEPGVVVLGVEGELSAKELGRRLEALRLPGFSVTIASLGGPDAITIRLQ